MKYTKQVFFFAFAFFLSTLIWNPNSSTADSSLKCEEPSKGLNSLSKSDIEGVIADLERKKRKIEQARADFIAEKGSKGGNVSSFTQKAQTCSDIIDIYKPALTKLEGCTEAIEKMKESRVDFNKSCGAFSSGKTKCAETIEACDKCPSAENFADYNCVSVHKQTKCPALAGKELEEAKEKREKLTEEIKELQNDIDEQEKDILSKEEELQDALAEVEEDFIKITRELERNTEEAKASLEEALKKGKGQIEENLAKQLVGIQKQIDEHLKIAHSFENAVYKANREYRKEQRQIRMECEAQAKVNLARFKAKRRAAIETGSLSFSLSSILKKGRSSFAAQNSKLLRKYYSSCLSKRKQDFDEVKADYQQKLRVIEQEKEKYLAVLARMRKQMSSLNQSAAKAGNQLLQDYTKQMEKILKRHDREYRAAALDYMKKKQLINSQTKNLRILEEQLRRTIHSLKSKESIRIREKELIDYLKSKGVSSDSDGNSEFAEAMAHYEELKGHIETAGTECDCIGDPPTITKLKCRDIQTTGNTIESFDSRKFIFDDSGNR